MHEINSPPVPSPLREVVEELNDIGMQQPMAGPDAQGMQVLL
jgi:hypothetical protein